MKLPLEVFRDAFQRNKFKLKELIDELWTLYITDTGGQPEFQELFQILFLVLLFSSSLFALTWSSMEGIRSSYHMKLLSQCRRCFFRV